MSSPDPSPAMSVVLPCYAAGPLAIRSAEALAAYLPSVAPTWEILIVDDGGNDFDAAALARIPGLRLVKHPRNLGKGAAVRTGVLAARGRVRVFTDADMPYDRELIPMMAEYIDAQGFHLVIGDRTLAGSVYGAATSFARRALSTVASSFIGVLVTGGFFDTQCGIKAVRGDVADALFPLVRIRRFAFDIEVIYLALKHGLAIKRVPVRLRRNLGTSVRPFPDAVRSALDILSIKLRQMRGQYNSEALASIVNTEIAALQSRYERTP
jgi:dolichyl-phosphate beta-glucosyltransferase